MAILKKETYKQKKNSFKKKPFLPIRTRVSNFSIQKLQNATLFLGYKKTYRNAKMFFDLAGSRNKNDLFNLKHTRTHFIKVLDFVSTIVSKYGSVWFVNPGEFWLDFTLFNLFSSFQKKKLFQHITLWSNKWTPGFFTNKQSSYKRMKDRPRFPHMLFYTNRTLNTQRLADGRNSNILQSGVSDSNGFHKAYTYSIAANEKTAKSNLFFLKIIINYVLVKVVKQNATFFKKCLKES